MGNTCHNFLPLFLINCHSQIPIILTLYSSVSGKLIFHRRHWCITYPSTLRNYKLSYFSAGVYPIQIHCQPQPYLNALPKYTIFRYITEVSLQIGSSRNSMHRWKNFSTVLLNYPHGRCLATGMPETFLEKPNSLKQLGLTLPKMNKKKSL